MDRFKTINTFVQIAKSQSLSKASDELGISRALVSAHLKQLEQHLGVRLFNRTTRHLSLTEPGTEYLAFCNDLIGKFEAEEARLSQAQAEPQGHLKIMASMGFGNAQLAPILTDFTAKHPGVRITLLLSDRSFSPADFVEGGYDLGISMHRLREGSIVTTKIADVTWLLCATKRYLQSHPAIQRPEDLAHHNCLIHRSHAPGGVWRFIGSTSEQIDVSVTGSLFTNSAIVLHAAVLRHGGISMLPRYVVGDDLEDGRLVQILDDFKSLSRSIYIVYREARYLPSRSRLFIDFLRQRMRSKAL